jgi:hypothetical protein
MSDEYAISNVTSLLGDSGSVRKRRLILHAGASKTGSSALQHHLAKFQLQLRERGILYPSAGLLKSPPKHQWIVTSLFSDNEAEFNRYMALVEQECSTGIHTIILSAEGIFNHWWDYGENTKQWLLKHMTAYDFRCWMWLREPVDFFRSYYLQLLRNPRNAMGIGAYGVDKTPTELLNVPWVAKHLDYIELCLQLEKTFGKDSVFIFSYSADIVPQAHELLGLNLFGDLEERENATTINDAGLSILKIINQYDLNETEKEKAYYLAAEISNLLGDRSEPVRLGEADCTKIRQLCGLSQQMLEEIGRQSIDKWNAIYGGSLDKSGASKTIQS